MSPKPREKRQTPTARLSRELDMLAEKVVLADPHSHVTLMVIAERFQSASEVAAEAAMPRFAQTAHAAASLASETGSDEESDPAPALETIERTVIALQAMIEKGENHPDIVVPDLPIPATPPMQSAPLQPAPPTATPAPSAVSDSPLIDDPALVAGFVTEAREHLDSAESCLLVLEKQADDREAMNTVFRAFHTIKGVAAFLGLGGIRGLAHDAETLLDKARRSGAAMSAPEAALALESADALRRLIDQVAADLQAGKLSYAAEPPPELMKRLHDACAGKAFAARSTPDSAAIAPAPEAGTQREATAAAVSAPTGNAARGTVVKETVRLDSERLDRLLDTIGELVIAEATVSQSAELRERLSPALERHISRLDKITRELQEISTSLRMVPVRATFRKMERLVHDLALRFGKQVALDASGEDTELDKSMVDMLGDPLVHMLRNTVDHGIETAEERRATGKTDSGTIWLRAYHRGGSIYIEVEDDGRGLDTKAILRKAREQGLVGPAEEPAEAVIHSMIFRPGFSTARQITDISGRGVGLDVVKRNVEALRGQVDLRTVAGKGTCFTLRLPLTLAIIDGLVVQVGQERYVVPSLNVVRAIHPGPGQIQTMLGKGEVLRYHDTIYPLYRLDHLLGSNACTVASHAVALLAEDEGSTVALLVDELVSKQQFVIKSLAHGVDDTPGMSGCAIMPDGTVGLILSVGGIVRLALGKAALADSTLTQPQNAL